VTAEKEKPRRCPRAAAKNVILVAVNPSGTKRKA